MVFFETNRNRQARHWMYETINNQLKDAFYNDPAVEKGLNEIERQVLEGGISPFKAAHKLLEIYNK